MHLFSFVYSKNTYSINECRTYKGIFCLTYSIKTRKKCIYSIEINGREEDDKWIGVLQSLLEWEINIELHMYFTFSMLEKYWIEIYISKGL